ncbi:hypothetical protein BDV98DRAFT_600190 [Pterulicium gracile]|uniref:F-box domain-containing protein n=1 Tax=Pterulicium gracile TaxID=1884261 RepID=A0A5C3R540_9AGAR|nr:hypothetical protein BDV98DRAFT_600190 [Pterula gracilis]
MPDAIHNHVREVFIREYQGNTDNLLAFLHSCPSLTILKWDNKEGEMNPDSPSNYTQTENLVLQNLTHLEARFADMQDLLYTVIPYIKTPKLQKLSISNFMDNNLSVVLSSLLSRSSCVLSSAQLVLPWVDEPHKPAPGLALLLEQLSNVEHLVVTCGKLNQHWDNGLNTLLL